MKNFLLSILIQVERIKLHFQVITIGLVTMHGLIHPVLGMVVHHSRTEMINEKGAISLLIHLISNNNSNSHHHLQTVAVVVATLPQVTRIIITLLHHDTHITVANQIPFQINLYQ